MQVALVILDGWGIGPSDDPTCRNAVAVAETPTVDGLLDRGPASTLRARGRDVGLPAGQMGNSEVGHLNIGAGRIVYQAYTRIEDAIAAADLDTIDHDADSQDPPFDRNEVIQSALDRAADGDRRLHLLGLLSDGGVHADHRHLIALLELAARGGIDAWIHAVTDGRDTDPTSAAQYLADVETAIDRHGTGAIATVIGRYFAMDRDENWERTHRAYRAIVDQDAPHRAPTAADALNAAYDRGETDEFVAPTRIDGAPAIGDGDEILWWNFRSDRARQLTRMLAGIRPEAWTADGIAVDPPAVTVTTMTEYDRTFELPVAFPPQPPTATIGSVLADADLTQLRIAESEKYAHVTYFLNGGREEPYPGERREIVPSPDVPTYDEAPAMAAAAVTDMAIDIIRTDDPDVLVLNYANPDMVGHTGDFEATVTAVETVDRELGRLLDAVQAAGGRAIVTADHGNAEDMGTSTEPLTAHTTNDVPIAFVPADRSTDGYDLRDGGILADVTPTLLDLLSVEQPAVMTGASLLVPEGNS